MVADAFNPESMLGTDVVAELKARQEQFVALFARHQSMIHGFILSLVPTWSDSADILQETSLTLWKKFDEFELGTDFLRWACRIADFEVRRFRERRGHDRLFYDDALLGLIAETRLAETDHLAQRRQALADCFARLSARDRELLRERYEANRQGKQIAAERGQPADSIYKALRRIRGALYDCVQRTLAREGRA